MMKFDILNIKTVFSGSMTGSMTTLFMIRLLLVVYIRSLTNILPGGCSSE